MEGRKMTELSEILLLEFQAELWCENGGMIDND